jgi:antirestriction protein ArdC
MSTTTDNLYAEVTADLIAKIEAGTSTWKMPWAQMAADRPISADGRLYRGINTFILPMEAARHGYTTHVWATYDQWTKHGGQVRKGEKSTKVILWKPTTKETEDGTERHLIARTFSVFAAEQVEGGMEHAAKLREATALTPTERIAECDRFFAAVGANVRRSDRAFYAPVQDFIGLPDVDAFHTTGDYYATAAHEHAHWTGHADRLNRDLHGRFGSESYAIEELIAEVAAAYWCAEHEIPTADRRGDHAAYVASWLRVLRADPTAIRTIASKAQAAADYLRTAANDRVEVAA